jgi:putative DNA primase/helicase
VSFENFARAHGVDIRRLIPDGRIRRCPTLAHPRSDNGAYSWDGERGWVQAWDGDGEVHWYDDPHARPPSRQQLQERAQRRSEDAERVRRKQERAAAVASGLLQQCAVGTHGYLRLKGFHQERALVLPTYTRRKRVDDGFAEVTSCDVLTVPMRDLRTNELLGAQLIWWSALDRTWVKEMVAGMRAKGAVLRLGHPAARETWLVEGYATGLSVLAALRQMRTDAAVLVCFSAGNLVHVAEAIQGRAFVFADNDASCAGEAAARRTGLPYCMAPNEGMDANDWHTAAGLLPLCAAMTRARREEVRA